MCVEATAYIPNNLYWTSIFDVTLHIITHGFFYVTLIMVILCYTSRNNLWVFCIYWKTLETRVNLMFCVVY